MATLLVAASLSPALAQSDYPSQRLNWTIAFGPGGGNDVMARTLIEIIQQYQLYPHPIVAENREGGSGAVGWGFVHANAGNPYHISTTSGSFITTPLQADTTWQPDDFTMVALLATDDLVLLVEGDSDINTLDEFVERARQNPPTVGGVGAAQVDFIVTTLLAREADYDFTYIPFNAQGALVTALLSGSVDAIVTNPGLGMGLIESGDVKPLAYTGVSTPEALGDLPTLQEAGYDVAMSMPRGLVLPPDVSDEVLEYWIGVMEQVVETPEWQEYITNQMLTENILYGDDFRQFIIDTRETFATILREEGMID